VEAFDQQPSQQFAYCNKKELKNEIAMPLET
jgi:hypothetical protein